MKKIVLAVKLFIFGIMIATISGCVGNSLPMAKQEEIDKYEKSYITEFETIKQNNANSEERFKWIQPLNKKQDCKVYVGIDPNNDKTIKSDYALYWDGECKNGFAHGLGREIEHTMIENLEQIGFYENGKAIDYCTFFSKLKNIETNGQCIYDKNKASNLVHTRYSEKNGDLEVFYTILRNMTNNEPYLAIMTSPFKDATQYVKSYPNYSYRIIDYSKDAFDNRNFEFITFNQNNKANGFSFAILKNGSILGGEFSNGTLLRRVQIPQSELNKANNILSEIRNVANVALDAQDKALIIKEKYKNKICKDSVKVDFIDNNDYKAICKEDQSKTQLRAKIDAKLAKIEQQKQAKRQDQNQQRLIQAREAEAIASQQAVAAQNQANFNQSLHNFNQNMQMQQLNNNLMMNNLMPKRYDVYIH